jgi:TATA-binding protein-associated factor Taf7
LAEAFDEDEDEDEDEKENEDDDNNDHNMMTVMIVHRSICRLETIGR